MVFQENGAQSLELETKSQPTTITAEIKIRAERDPVAKGFQKANDLEQFKGLSGEEFDNLKRQIGALFLKSLADIEKQPLSVRDTTFENIEALTGLKPLALILSVRPPLQAHIKNYATETKAKADVDDRLGRFADKLYGAGVGADVCKIWGIATKNMPAADEALKNEEKFAIDQPSINEIHKILAGPNRKGVQEAYDQIVAVVDPNRNLELDMAVLGVPMPTVATQVAEVKPVAPKPAAQIQASPIQVVTPAANPFLIPPISMQLPTLSIGPRPGSIEDLHSLQARHRDENIQLDNYMATSRSLFAQGKIDSRFRDGTFEQPSQEAINEFDQGLRLIRGAHHELHGWETVALISSPPSPAVKADDGFNIGRDLARTFGGIDIERVRPTRVAPQITQYPPLGITGNPSIHPFQLAFLSLPTQQVLPNAKGTIPETPQVRKQRETFDACRANLKAHIQSLK